jgi:hypothetical protein
LVNTDRTQIRRLAQVLTGSWSSGRHAPQVDNVQRLGHPSEEDEGIVRSQLSKHYNGDVQARRMRLTQTGRAGPERAGSGSGAAQLV